MAGKTARALGALTAAALTITGAILLASGSASAANLVSNSGFDTGSTSGWTCSGKSSAVTSPKRSGSHALSATPEGSDNARCSQTVQVRPNTAYSLSAWVQGSYVYLGVSGTGGDDKNTWTPGSTGFSELKLGFTTGAGATSVTVYLHGWYGQPTYYADDVVLDGPGGTQPTTTTPPTTTTKPTTTTTKPTTTTPPTTTPPTTTTSNNPGQPDPALPKHLLTGYWHNFDNGSKALKLADVPRAYDIVAVSFADAVPTRPGAVSFTLDPGLAGKLGGYTDAQFKADVKTLKSRGQKVIISVGGERGTISVGDSTASANFANSVKDLVASYGFDGVDVDLENGVNATHMAPALRAIHAAGGKIITMAPQTIDMQSTGTEYFKLALAVKDILTVVNMQFYNSGAMLGCDQKVYSQGSVDFLVSLACVQLENGLRPDQVGLGLPSSGSAAGGGYQSPANVNAALDCLARGTGCGSFKPAKTWPGIRGAMTWSINWDATANWQFSNTVAPHLKTLP
ncbi:chitinase [Actinosynnema mirum]|uniref:chitinase n=1 Tax=Actinosynnema mirum (strain ATCC 29888 / DSM 43827 / JCM 3225 / NBRC 14064 / NCIMB 13271 / NRRL B-12336 / IMRU 3971 / 101) TaxID=446462 RepID=C6WRC0_ACTMD|nr:Carbohydrate-binding CenC domain protein [Actinosynnema mirum DSM 43827]